MEWTHRFVSSKRANGLRVDVDGQYVSVAEIGSSSFLADMEIRNSTVISDKKQLPTTIPTRTLKTLQF
jgi:hypothetical protein